MNRSSWLGQYNRWGGQLNWFIPWRDESYVPVLKLMHADSTILEALEKHPWINAVGWDVLLSVILLCFWSTLSSTNARDLIRCSVFPKLQDETEEPVPALRPRRGLGRPAKRSQDTRRTGRSSSRRRTRADHTAAAPAPGDSQDHSKPPTFISYLHPAHIASLMREGTDDAGPAEEDPSHRQEEAGDAEAAGLTWCLWVLGGLGTASAAVFGANSEI